MIIEFSLSLLQSFTMHVIVLAYMRVGMGEEGGGGEIGDYIADCTLGTSAEIQMVIHQTSDCGYRP